MRCNKKTHLDTWVKIYKYFIGTKNIYFKTFPTYAYFNAFYFILRIISYLEARYLCDQWISVHMQMNILSGWIY